MSLSHLSIGLCPCRASRMSIRPSNWNDVGWPNSYSTSWSALSRSSDIAGNGFQLFCNNDNNNCTSMAPKDLSPSYGSYFDDNTSLQPSPAYLSASNHALPSELTASNFLPLALDQFQTPSTDHGTYACSVSTVDEEMACATTLGDNMTVQSR